MTTGKGGRPTLGKDGEKRINTAIGCEKDGMLRLSLLERHREDLKQIGEGNMSAGFRKVMERHGLLLLARADLQAVGDAVGEEFEDGDVPFYSSIIVLLNALAE